jgi:predicted RNA-binding protein with EMAP domain
MIDAQSERTRAKYYYEIITMFHSASAILHNGRYHYKDLMGDIDMEEIKQFLKEKAKSLLKEVPSRQSWSWQVREAALKSLDLDDMI